MENSKVIVLILIVIISCSQINGENSADGNDAESDMWDVFRRETRKMWSDCRKVNFSVVSNCLKHGSLNVLDKMLASDKIPLIAGLSLVQDKTEKMGKKSAMMSDVEENAARSGKDGTSFVDLVRRRIGKVLENRNLKFDLQSLFNNEVKETGRNRRRHQMGYMMMMFAVGTMMFIGFQFLAVLGGKAFLMAKLALLLASINGLKRIASSGVHYGLYQTAPDHHAPGFGYGYHGYIDRDMHPIHSRFE